MRPRDIALGGFVAVALASPVAAQPSPDTGQVAFEQRDFATAAALWRAEASAGSAEAALGLGLIQDLGLGLPRDSAKALRWYLEAAAVGLPEAQFNVAVMLDAGAGVPRDASAAVVWYSRAAANGHHRAQYNLALMLESGDGAPRNRDLARHWLGLAAEALPAAGDRLATLAASAPGAQVFVPPLALAGDLVPRADGLRVELVWASPPAPAGARYIVEVARSPRSGALSGDLVLARSTDASALVADLPGDAAGYAWRVSLVDTDAARYAASKWQWLDAASTGARPGDRDTRAADLPDGRVTLSVAADDAAALHLARELSDGFVHAGFWVRIEPSEEAADQSGVRYAYFEDAGLASSITSALPVLSTDSAVRSTEAGALPGEIVVRLVGGPKVASK